MPEKDTFEILRLINSGAPLGLPIGDPRVKALKTVQWVVDGDGGLRLTTEGRTALADFRRAAELVQA